MFNSVHAAEINSANIISGGDCGSLLIYKGIVVKTYYAQYTQNGLNYPAYCLDKTKHGVDNELSYSVSVQNAISDVRLWRIIVNGYPYKTVEQLGCSNKEEAFTATKQAIYCYIHGNNPNDYSPIGEAGIRTLNALNQILRDAENCNETQISNTIKIIKEQENFEVDSKELGYVSKVYSIEAGTTISNYKIELQSLDSELPEGIRVTDISNNSKDEFSQNDKFKVLIPIKNLSKDAGFNIFVNTKINSKPVLYGKSANEAYQDYALTAATYEEALGSTKDNYYKNETKVKIVKQDKETKERLENVEFNILDNNKQILYSNLKTNFNGEVEVTNFLPGKYYLQEVNARDGYVLDEQLIEFEVLFNQELILTVDNLFEKVPDKEDAQKCVVSEDVVRKLPVTGM